MKKTYFSGLSFRVSRCCCGTARLCTMRLCGTVRLCTIVRLCGTVRLCKDRPSPRRGADGTHSAQQCRDRLKGRRCPFCGHNCGDGRGGAGTRRAGRTRGDTAFPGPEALRHRRVDTSHHTPVPAHGHARASDVPASLQQPRPADPPGRGRAGRGVGERPRPRGSAGNLTPP